MLSGRKEADLKNHFVAFGEKLRSVTNPQT